MPYCGERIPHAQIVVIHADLGRVEWEGVKEHIEANIDHPLNVVRANKGLLDMVRHRFATRPHVPSWPSSATRQCTSDLKRNPIQKFIRRDMAARRATLAVNCVGLRAEESAPRARRLRMGHEQGPEPRRPHGMGLSPRLAPCHRRGVPDHPRRRPAPLLGLPDRQRAA